MLKEIFSQKRGTHSQTVNNAIIKFTDTDDSGKGKRFKSRFIQPGLAGYPGEFGNVLVRKETLDKSLNTMVGAPVIINHKDITKENADNERVGVVSNAYYNEKDGWYWCEGVIWDEDAQHLVNDKGWSVSCSYDFLEVDDEGGTENNIEYDREFTKLNFVHLALVDNPRYERANIVFNSKTVIENFNPYHGEDGKFCDKESKINSLIKDIEPVEINSDDIPVFKSKQWDKLSEYVTRIFKENRNLEIKDNNRQILLSGNGAKRTYSKQNPQDKSHNAVYTKIKEVVERAKYFSFQDTDEEHPNVKGQEIYYSKINIDNEPYKVKIVVDVPLDEWLERGATYNYAGHRTSKIKIAPVRNTLSVEEQHRRTAPDAIYIIPHFETDLNSKGQNMLNEVNNDKRITIHPNGEDGKGRPLLLKDGESPKDAIERTYKKDKSEKSEREEENREEKLKKYIADGYHITGYFDGGHTRKDVKFKLYKGNVDTFNLNEGDIPITKEEAFLLEKSLDKDNGWKMKKYKDNSGKDYWEVTKDGKVYARDYDEFKAKKYFDENRKNKAHNSKGADMALIEELKKLITKVENSKEEEMEDKKKEVDNEKVDKRKLIDEVGGILKGKVDEEVWRTIIGKIEKIGYNESEAGTADNKKEDEKEYKELKKEVKEDVENKCKNSVDNSKNDYFNKLNEIYNTSFEEPQSNDYVSKADRMKAAEEYFAF